MKDDEMTCFFRWGREKYSKGREVGVRGKKAGGEGGSRIREREEGVGDPLSTQTYLPV